MEHEGDGDKAAATTQIAALLVVAEQITALIAATRDVAEATRQQTEVLKSIANTLEANKEQK